MSELQRNYNLIKELIFDNKIYNKQLDQLLKGIINLEINKNIKEREENLEKDIGTMLNRIFEKNESSLDMNSLIFKNGDRYTIETDPSKIKELTRNHFEQWTSKRNINTEIITNNKEWSHVYKARMDIDEPVYEDLMKEIMLEEVKDIINKK